MATATLSAAPKRHRPLLLVIAVLLALLVTVLLFWPERDEPTAHVTYGSLASSNFTAELPLGIVLDRRRTVPLSGEGKPVGRVSFFDVRRTGGAEGGIVVVSYQVYRSAVAARSAYETQLYDLREANDVQSRDYRFFETEITRSHTCVDEGQEFCLAVAGNVTLEALSRIHLFEPGQLSRVGEILGPALEHLGRVTESP